MNQLCAAECLLSDELNRLRLISIAGIYHLMSVERTDDELACDELIPTLLSTCFSLGHSAADISKDLTVSNATIGRWAKGTSLPAHRISKVSVAKAIVEFVKVICREELYINSKHHRISAQSFDVIIQTDLEDAPLNKSRSKVVTQLPLVDAK